MRSPARRLIPWIVLPPLAAIVAAFAVANRAPLRVSFDPLPVAYEVPTYAALLAALVGGFIAGALATWLSGHHSRRALRHARRRLTAMDGDLDGLRARLAQPTAPPALPPLSPRPRADAAMDDR